VDHDDARLRLRSMRDVIRDAITPGLARRVLHTKFHFTSVEEPGSFRDAEQSKAWRRLMNEEMDSI
jgi:hypothetical protein